eukprot:jgi/Mesvir1/13177/Mv06140-RA.1
MQSRLAETLRGVDEIISYIPEIHARKETWNAYGELLSASRGVLLELCFGPSSSELRELSANDRIVEDVVTLRDTVVESLAIVKNACATRGILGYFKGKKMGERICQLAVQFEKCLDLITTRLGSEARDRMRTDMEEARERIFSGFFLRAHAASVGIRSSFDTHSSSPFSLSSVPARSSVDLATVSNSCSGSQARWDEEKRAMEVEIRFLRKELAGMKDHYESQLAVLSRVVSSSGSSKRRSLDCSERLRDETNHMATPSVCEESSSADALSSDNSGLTIAPGRQMASTCTDPVPPRSFLCPISMELMVDPVVITDTLQTCDRTSAEHWFSAGNRTCPVTGADLSSLELMPNLCMRHTIDEWASDHGVCLKQAAQKVTNWRKANALMTPASKTPVAGAGYGSASMLGDPIYTAVQVLKNGTQRQKEAAARMIRRLSMDEANKPTLALEGAIPPLIALLKIWSAAGQEAAAGALCNLSDNDSNNKVIIAREGAIAPLVLLLRFGHPEGREAAAEVLRNLAAYNTANTARIVEEGAIPILVELLQVGTAGAKEAAALALANLALSPENQSRIGAEGAAPILARMLSSSSLDLQAAAASTLCNLSFHAQNREAIRATRAPLLLPRIAQNGNNLGKQAAAMAMQNLCPPAPVAECKGLAEGSIPGHERPGQLVSGITDTICV